MDQLRAMRVFARVIDEGSFAGAARALDLAPAVVTRLIAELEEHLGTRLIQRTTRSLSLSPLGERYLERVRAILADLDETEALIQTSSDEPQGHVRLQAPGAFLTHQLARHLPAFHAEHPRVTLTLTAAPDGSGPDEHHDLTILALRDPPDCAHFAARLLARSEVILCATPAYLTHAGRPAVPQALEQHTLLLPPSSLLQRDFALVRPADGASARVPMPRQPLLSTSHTDTLQAAALAGLGIAGLTSMMADEALRQGTLERVLPDWQASGIGLWLMLPAHRHVPSRTRVLRDFLLRLCGGENRDPWQAAVSGCRGA
jgi:DNA-binding transcriptional LysR family regulator